MRKAWFSALTVSVLALMSLSLFDLFSLQLAPPLSVDVRSRCPELSSVVSSLSGVCHFPESLLLGSLAELDSLEPDFTVKRGFSGRSMATGRPGADMAVKRSAVKQSWHALYRQIRV